MSRRFGLENFADITHGGAWYIGFLAAPGVSEMLLAGRERDFLTKIAYPAMCAVPDAVSSADLDEFTRTYSRPEGWRGAIGLYQSMLKEGPEIQELAQSHKVNVPVLAIGAVPVSSLSCEGPPHQGCSLRNAASAPGAVA